MKKIICVGNSAYDMTMPLEKYPVENYKFRATDFCECGGGATGNGAYLLAKWGEDVTLVGAVGNDIYGKKIIDEFKEVNINLKYFQVLDDSITTLSFILVNNQTGSRTILTRKDEELKLEPVVFKGDYDVFLGDGYFPEEAIRILNANPNIISVLDAGSLKEGTLKIAPLVKYLVTSKNFAQDFTKININENNYDRVFAEMEKTFKNNIIITLEEEGCIFKEDGVIKKMPAIKIDKVVDTTGTGDIFHGAFTYGVANGYSLSESIKIATVTAGLSVKYLGGRNSIRPFEEVKAILKI